MKRNYYFKSTSAAFIASGVTWSLLSILAISLMRSLESNRRMSFAFVVFVDEIMVFGLARHLGKMGDGDELQRLSHLSHDASDFGRHLTRNARVDFVEDEGGDVVVVRNGTFDGEHQAREFASRGHATEVVDGNAFVGGKEETDFVAAFAAKTILTFHADLKLGKRHGQLPHQFRDFFTESRGCLATPVMQGLGFL